MTTAIGGGSRAGPPWHLWAVGVLGLFWNGFGVYDYLMTHTRGEPYLREMGLTDAQLAYFGTMPAWATGVWAVGVWGALAGTLLLLFRSRWATIAFAASLAAFLVSLVYSYLLSDASKVMGPQAAVMNVVILAGTVGFVAYSQWMAKRGVLH